VGAKSTVVRILLPQPFRTKLSGGLVRGAGVRSFGGIEDGKRLVAGLWGEGGCASGKKWGGVVVVRGGGVWGYDARSGR